MALKDPRTGLGWVERGTDYVTTYSLFDTPAHLVAIQTLQGKFDEASRMLEELQSRLRQSGQPTFGLWPDEMALLWIRKGEWDYAEAQLSEAFDLAVTSENRLVEASTANRLGDMYLARRKDTDAERYFLHSLDLIKSSGSIVGKLALLPHLCELYCRTGQLTKANEALIQAQNIAGEAKDWGALEGDLWLAEGFVSVAMGRRENVDASFQRSVQVYQQFFLPWDEARAYYEWAIALMENGTDGLHTNYAMDLLRRALSLWEPMGASHYAEQCRRRLA